MPKKQKMQDRRKSKVQSEERFYPAQQFIKNLEKEKAKDEANQRDNKNTDFSGNI